MTRDSENIDSRSINEEEIHAYVDGWLSDERRAAVEQLCEENPAVAERVRDYQEQNRMLHERFDSVLAEDVPPSITLPKPTVQVPSYLRIAAAIGWLALGGVIGWVANQATPEPSVEPTVADTAAFVKQAMFAHKVYAPEAKHPVEVRADQEAHLVKWLSNRLGQKILVPDLMPTGYWLVGGRLLPSYHGGVAAQFMYEDDDGDRCSLYLMTGVNGKRRPGFHFVQTGTTRAYYWVDESFGYVMAGDVEKERLLDMARLAQHQLSFSHPKQL